MTLANHLITGQACPSDHLVLAILAIGWPWPIVMIGLFFPDTQTLEVVWQHQRKLFANRPSSLMVTASGQVLLLQAYS